MEEFMIIIDYIKSHKIVIPIANVSLKKERNL